MESWIKLLLTVIFGPFLLLLIIGLAISNLIVIEVGIGYILIWFVFAAFIYNYLTRLNLKYSRWPGTGRNLRKLAQVEDIEIPIGGGKYLKGDILKSDVTPKKDAPVLIMCHGLGGSRGDYYMIGLALIKLGFAWFSYDSRGHGQSKNVGDKSDSLYIIKDLKKALDFIETREDLSHTKIIAIGASMGASIVLNEGYLDPRIDFIIAICAWADFQYTATRQLHGLNERFVKLGYKMMGINLDPTNLQNRFVSPIYYSFNKKRGWFDHPIPWEVDNNYRLCLSHCKTDHVIPFRNYERNMEFLQLPPENTVVFNDGDHAFAGNETALAGKIIYWLARHGYV